MFGIDDAIIGAAVGAIGSGLFGMASASESADASERIANEANANSALQSKIAFDRSMEAYGKRYQMTAADMRAAGLNPILAASGGFSVGNAPTAAPAQTFVQSYVPNYASSARDVGDLFKSGVEAFAASSASEKSRAEVTKIDAEVQKLGQDVLESIDRQFKLRAETGLATAQEKEAYASIQERMKRIEVMSSEIFKLNQEVREFVSRESLNYSSRALAESGVDLNRSKQGEIAAMIGKLGQETTNLRYEAAGLEREADIYKGSSGGVVRFIEKIMQKISLPGILINKGKRRP